MARQVAAAATPLRVAQVLLLQRYANLVQQPRGKMISPVRPTSTVTSPVAAKVPDMPAMPLETQTSQNRRDPSRFASIPAK
jgi:hypothetical protein